VERRFGSREVPVAVLIGAGGRREIWRFGDEPDDEIDLARGRPMRRP
jgi:hypothetical protein